MNRALGMRIRQPLRYCCFGGVSTILLRKKTYGRRTLLCTPVLLEIKPELVVTRLKITFVIGNLAKAMIWMRLFPAYLYCLQPVQWSHPMDYPAVEYIDVERLDEKVETGGRVEEEGTVIVAIDGDGRVESG
ncbi:hypothetical protein P5673_009698 [Acropora cervicornis]|uniref:Uncharacterized protein n=1 Tax=Acropora cervicornis TaxID=6130 RepID=A0AAD9QRU4_ACRCE|nr:hypothetical protein P5673_009698 [Acropora cervicornis]